MARREQSEVLLEYYIGDFLQTSTIKRVIRYDEASGKNYIIWDRQPYEVFKNSDDKWVFWPSFFDTERYTGPLDIKVS